MKHFFRMIHKIQPEFSGAITGFYMASFINAFIIGHRNGSFFEKNPWWLCIIGMLIGIFVISQIHMKIFSDRFVYHYRNWVRIQNGYSAYILNVAKNGSSRNQLVEWCQNNSKGNWLVSHKGRLDVVRVCFNRRSDMAMFLLTFEGAKML